MNKQPRTIKQLRNRLAEKDFLGATDRLPFGKHRGKSIEDVVKSDPNYIVWWDEKIGNRIPLDPKLVKIAQDNYKPLTMNAWTGYVNISDDLWGDGDWMDSPEGVHGDPWGEGHPPF